MTLDHNNYTPNSIRTYSGKVFDLKIMDPDSICIHDIAHALSYTNRFGGHLERPYSVAQHCCLASEMVPEEHRLAALLHDASEAYLGDMPSPFKKLMPDFKYHEDRLMEIIAEKFGFQWPLHPIIKEVDKLLLDQEWDCLVMGLNKSIGYWSPEDAKLNFLYNFNYLTTKKRMNLQTANT